VTCVDPICAECMNFDDCDTCVENSSKIEDVCECD